MDSLIWPENGQHNPIIFYLLGRRRSVLLDDAVGLAGWLFLLALEAAACAYPFFMMSMTAWQFLIPIELLVMPLVLGLWTQLMVFLHYRRFRGRLPIEEMMTTRLGARDILCGFALRPIMLQMGANFLFTAIAVFGVGVTCVYAISSSSLFHVIDFVVVIAVLIYRFFVLNVCIEYAGIHAVRACLFIEDSMKVMTRMARDWIFPWGLIPILFAVFGAVVYMLTASIPGLMCMLLPFIICGMAWFVWAAPSLLRSFAQEVFYTLEIHNREWVIRTGEEYSAVPQRIWERWKLTIRRK